MFLSLHRLFQSTEISNDTLDALESFNYFSNLNIETRIVSQLNSIELFRPVPCRDDYSITYSSGLKRLLQAFVELVRMYTLERWKLNEPLVYNFDVGAAGWYDHGRDIWCADPLRNFKFKLMFSKSFWFDKVH